MKNSLEESFIYKVTDWIIKLVYLNILWAFFTIAGGIVMGLFPASAALLSVTRKWIIDQNGNDIPILKQFFTSYRKEFWKANALGYVITLIGVILIADLMVVNTFDHSVSPVLMSILGTLILLFIIVCFFIFPVFVHFELSLLNNLKYSFIVGISSLHYAVFMMVSCFIIIALLLFFPAVTMFFAASLLGLLVMAFSLKAFNRIKMKQSTAQ